MIAGKIIYTYTHTYIYICCSVLCYPTLSNCPRKNSYDDELIEGSLEVDLPTRWTDGKAEVGRGRREKIREEKESEERKCRCAKSRKKKGTLISVLQNEEKIAIYFVFPMICGSGGSKSKGSLKRRVRSHLAR